MPPPRRPPPAALLLLLLALVASPARAHPFLYKVAACDSHPTQALGRHNPPRFDPGTTFELRSPRGRTVTGACPGVAYVLTVAFPAGEARKVLLTASLGTLANSTRGCPGKEATGEMAAAVRTVWTPPCPAALAALAGAAAAAGAPAGVVPVELRATSAAGPNGAYWQARAVVPVRLGCVNNGCGKSAAAARFSAAPPAAARGGRR